MLCSPSPHVVPSAHPHLMWYPLLTLTSCGTLCSPSPHVVPCAHPHLMWYPVLTLTSCGTLCSPSPHVVPSAHPHLMWYPLLTLTSCGTLCSPSPHVVPSAHPHLGGDVIPPLIHIMCLTALHLRKVTGATVFPPPPHHMLHSHVLVPRLGAVRTCYISHGASSSIAS